MSRLSRWLNVLPLGVPQIIGAVLAIAVLGLVALLHPRIGGATIGVNWTSFLAFVGFSVLLAVVAALYGRRRRP